MFKGITGIDVGAACAACGVAALICLAGGPGGQTDRARSHPTDKPAREVIASRALGEIVRGVVSDLGSSDPGKRAEAERALQCMTGAYFEGLLAKVDHPDRNISRRAVAALEAAKVNAELAAGLAALPKASRAKLRVLVAAKPGIVAGAFSGEPARRAQAIRRIGGLRGASDLAESLVLRGLKDDSPMVVLAALKTARTIGKKSIACIDAVSDLVIAGALEDWDRLVVSKERKGDRAEVLYEASETLARLGGSRPVPKLVAMMSIKRSWVRYSLLAEIVGASGEKRAIPILVKQLDDNTPVYRLRYHSSDNDENAVFTFAPSDAALASLLLLTGQSPRKYGLTRLPTRWSWYKPYGFTSVSRRRTAVTRFRTWWEANRNKGVYKGLGRLEVPKLPPGADTMPEEWIRRFLQEGHRQPR